MLAVTFKLTSDCRRHHFIPLYPYVIQTTSSAESISDGVLLYLGIFEMTCS